MKKTILLTLIIYSFNIVFSQENYSNSNTSGKYVSDFLSSTKNINYVNSNGYYFVDIPENKDYKSRLSGEILIKDSSNIDLLSLDVQFSIDDYNYYYVSNLNTLLVVKSIDHIKNEINLND